MLWSASVEAFSASTRAVTAELRTVVDMHAPALGSWDVAGLAGHLIRQIGGPAAYLAEPPPDHVELADPAAYYLAYLAWRSDDPDTADASVAARGNAAAGQLTAESAAEQMLAALDHSLDAMAAAGPDRAVPTPFGSMRLADYLPTRTFEVVVHGLDLGHALDRSWRPPDPAVEQCLGLLGAIAARSGRAGELLLLATGRAWVRPDDVFPLIR